MNKINIFVVSWISFIIVHTLFLDVVEEYRTIYLCLTLFTILPLTYILNAKLLKPQDIELGLILIVVMHLIFIYGQLLDIMDSNNEYFRLTGCNENPTVTAIFLTGCIPLITKHAVYSKHRTFYFFLLISSLVAIVLLHCRSAYLGLCVEFLVFLLLKVRKSKALLPAICKYRVTIIFTFLFFTIPVAIRIYDMKRDSSDSRWLIWKLSAQMITEKPQGCGYGLFEKYYNIKQADYFKSGYATLEEKRTASFCNMAYNDYLEHGVEGGFIGMFFLTAFYILLVTESIRKSGIEATCVVSSLAVMSLTNFVYSSMQPWWLLICCASLISYRTFSLSPKPKESILALAWQKMGGFIPTNKINFCHKNYIAAIATMAFLSTAVFFKVLYMTTSQIKLKTYFDTVAQGKKVSNDKLQHLKSHIGTSEAYLNTCAYNCMLNNNYNDAIKYLDKACQYTSSQQSLTAHYVSYRCIGQENKAIKYIDTICYIQPSLLRPKHILMEYYDKIGDKEKATAYAKDILSTKPRVRNDEISYIQYKASEYINNKTINKKK